ncbi:hypothetical protein E2C01_002258 [Portunus trituberculatus]|uniref:Uncharacterized protein n=1 Tax=Portunus trituberculatus TaxID=210409 RepID=A0A5B7CIY3_PORTR|nr:hypothetical protein [Portunus trituberculatus]
MAKVLPSLLLLLPLSSEGISSPTMACNATEIVLEKTEDVESIQRKQESNISMVGKPESGFRGLLLTVTESSNVELRAWLRGEHQCFPQGDEWQHVEAWWAVTNKSSVSMGIVTEECQLMCTINHQLQVQQSVPEFELLAYGPSRWIAKRLPDFCNITYRDASNVQHLNFSVCDIALFDKNTALGMNTASTTASSSWLSLPLFVSTTSLLLAALVVAVMLIVYLKRHQHILPGGEAGLGQQK